MTLTEQWKKGKLEAGWYYVLLSSNEEYITFIDGNWVVDDRLVGADIEEILAPVPTYEEWQELKEQSVKKTDTYYDMVIAARNGEIENLKKENQQLKKLLLQIRNRQSLIREYLSDCKLGNAWDLLYQTENEIDNAIGEKSE